MTTDCPAPFGEALKSFRTARHFTQQHLASKDDVYRNTIIRWEQGDTLPDSKSIVLEVASCEGVFLT
jgi:transcriptional regulator with XRE-family HTH domain